MLLVMPNNRKTLNMSWLGNGKYFFFQNFFVSLQLSINPNTMRKRGKWQQGLACFCQPSLLRWISEVEIKFPAHFCFLWIRLPIVEMHKINDLWKRCLGFCSLYKTANAGMCGKIVYKLLFSISALPSPFYWSHTFVVGTTIREGWGQLLLSLGGAIPCTFLPNVVCPCAPDSHGDGGKLGFSVMDSSLQLIFAV